MKCPVRGKSVLPTFGKLTMVAILAFCFAVFCAMPVFAQTSTSPQGGAAIYTQPAICASSQSGFSGAQNFQPCVDSANNGQWFTVMNAAVKTSSNKTLFVSPSLITGLYTNTQVKGNGSSQLQLRPPVLEYASFSTVRTAAELAACRLSQPCLPRPVTRMLAGAVLCSTLESNS